MAGTSSTQKFIVTYEDGTEHELKVKPRHLIAFEDEVGVGLDVKSIRDGYKLPWIASGTPLPFDEWIATVDDIESDGPVVEPTVEVVSGDGEAVESVPTE